MVQLMKGPKLSSFPLNSVYHYAESFPRYRTDVCQTVRMILAFKNVRSIE